MEPGVEGAVDLGDVVVSSSCGQRVDRGAVDRAMRGDEHEVAADLGIELLGRGNDGHVFEHFPERGDLGPGEVERRVVDQIDEVEAVVVHHPIDLVGEFERGEMPRHGEPSEGVTQHEIVGVVVLFEKPGSGITGADL